MKKIVTLTALVASILLHSGSSLAQTSKELSELRREIEALKNGQLAIQKDLAEIKNLILQKELQTIKDMLQSKQAPTVAPAQAPTPPAEPQNVLVSVDGGAVKGDKNAKVTLVEFTDYQCPFCNRHFREVMPQIETDYVKTGKVRYVLQCLDAGKYATKVRKDFADAQKAGTTGTPTFFLGFTDPKGAEIKVVKKIVGAQSFAAFKEAIDSVLNSQTTEKPESTRSSPPDKTPY